MPGPSFGSSMRCHFLVRRPVDDGKAVEVGKLDEHALGRAVGIRLERHRAHSEIEVHHPRELFGLDVDDGRRLAGDATCDDVAPVRRHVGVVHGALDWDALHLLQRDGVDDIDQPRLSRIAT